jgi:hypothetical protein
MFFCLFNRSMEMLFLNRVNSWLKDRKEKTEIDQKQWVHRKSNTFLLSKCLGMRLFFLTIPKPLKQYTFFKKKIIHSALRVRG